MNEHARDIAFKMHDVYNTLGFTYSIGRRLIHISREVETACHRISPNGKEQIILNEDLVRALPARTIRVLLMHEFMHRILYNGVQQRFDNAWYANLVLDIVIDKILDKEYEDELYRLNRNVLPEAIEKDPCCLIYKQAARDKMDPHMRIMHASIWDTDAIPNPSSLYYRLIPFAERYSTMVLRVIHDYVTVPQLQSDAKDALRGLKGMFILLGGDKTGQVEKICNEYGDAALYAEKSELSAFIHQMKIRKYMSSFTQKIKQQLNRTVAGTNPYPLFLTRLGMIYATEGISDVTGRFINRVPLPMVPKIRVYVDASASMCDCISRILWLLSELDEYIEEVFSFDTAVYPVPRDQLKKNMLRGGGGTSFTRPVCHFLESDAISALFITDGYANLAREVAEDLKKSGRYIYTVLYGKDRNASSICAASRAHITIG